MDQFQPSYEQSLHNFEQNMLNINRALFSIQSTTIRCELASIQDRLYSFEQYLLDNPPPIEEDETQRQVKRRRTQ